MFSRVARRTRVIVFTMMSYLVLSTAFYLSGTSSLQGQTKHHVLPLYSATAEGSESHDLDAIEDELIRRQSLQPSSKSYTNKSKRSRRKTQQTIPIKQYSNNVNKANRATTKNRRQRGSKSSSTLGTIMPPWLSRYENDNLIGSYQRLLGDTESPSLSSYTYPKENFDGGAQNTVSSMQRLQLAMSGIFYHPDSEQALLSPNAISYFTQSEINDVLDSIRVASHSNLNLMDGCADFLYMMLTLEEEGVLTSDLLKKERWDDDDIDDHVDEWSATFNDGGNQSSQPHSIMTRDVLVAASFHYCDCVRARKGGVYDYVRKAMGASFEQSKQEQLLPTVSEEKNSKQRNNRNKEILVDVGESLSTTTASIMTIKRRGKPSIERYGKESASIAAGAARLKRAEIMTSVYKRNPNTSHSDAETLRSFLITLSEDWRGLVIRSAACLYRLRGLPQSSGEVVLSTTTMRTARDALRVYAPLAQRLGMQRLKSELENTAFRILYRRQYSVASSLYGDDIDEMKAIVEVLTSRMEQLLRSDPIFRDQIDDVTVTSRIKEPYSLWKKMLRIRKQAADAKRQDDISDIVDIDAATIRWVPDAIALRVILRASALSPLEEEDSVRTREKMLCYYALQLISDVWPASTANKAKDYIQNPKKNGYQSLHYTANLIINGDNWPFEVQIRSEEMHKVAEFGVAAHWDYKLESKAAALPDASHSPVTSLPILALPMASNTTLITKRERDAEQHSKKSLIKGRMGRIESYIEALTTSRESLVQTNLFVFISSTESALDGHLISIDPSITRISELLKKCGVEPESDICCSKIFRNGAQVTLEQELCLCNGDVLTLPASFVAKLKVN